MHRPLRRIMCPSFRWATWFTCRVRFPTALTASSPASWARIWTWRQVKAACDGDIDRLVRVVKLTAFVNSTPEFTEQPKVVNGASDFLVEALGDAGRHSRSAVSAASLPLGVAVEIEGIFQVK